MTLCAFLATIELFHLKKAYYNTVGPAKFTRINGVNDVLGFSPALPHDSLTFVIRNFTGSADCATGIAKVRTTIACTKLKLTITAPNVSATFKTMLNTVSIATVAAENAVRSLVTRTTCLWCIALDPNPFGGMANFMLSTLRLTSTDQKSATGVTRSTHLTPRFWITSSMIHALLE